MTTSSEHLKVPERVVIIGAGYAGLFASRRVRVRARGEDVEVTLVDPATAWVERTRLHQLACGDPSVRSMPFADLFAGTDVRTLAGTVIDLDVDAHEVEVRGGDGATTRLGFDHLVYALGSTADTSAVPGAARHAHVLDTGTTTGDLHRALAAAPQARVAVVGGGLTGVETAAEIAATDPDRPVTLVTSAPIGAGVSDRGRRHLASVLDRLGVQVLDGTSVARVEESGLTTTTGQEIPAELVIWTAGLAVPDLAARSGLATDEDGRVLVDATLRSVSHPEVFAAGDSARPVESVGAPVRASAYVATIMGAQAGTNLARTLAGKDPRPLASGT